MLSRMRRGVHELPRLIWQANVKLGGALLQSIEIAVQRTAIFWEGLIPEIPGVVEAGVVDVDAAIFHLSATGDKDGATRLAAAWESYKSVTDRLVAERERRRNNSPLLPHQKRWRESAVAFVRCVKGEDWVFNASGDLFYRQRHHIQQSAPGLHSLSAPLGLLSRLGVQGSWVEVWTYRIPDDRRSYGSREGGPEIEGVEPAWWPILAGWTPEQTDRATSLLGAGAACSWLRQIRLG